MLHSAGEESLGRLSSQSRHYHQVKASPAVDSRIHLYFFWVASGNQIERGRSDGGESAAPKRRHRFHRLLWPSHGVFAERDRTLVS